MGKRRGGGRRGGEVEGGRGGGLWIQHLPSGVHEAARKTNGV